MSAQPPTLRWTAADNYAATRCLSRDAVMAQVEAGTLTALIARRRWYILEEAVSLEIPDPSRPEHARLHIAGTREGNWLNVGGADTVVLDVTYDDTIRTAIGQLYGPSSREPRGTLVLILGRETLRVDEPLHADLLSALLAWQIEVELGDLLERYRPDGQ